jgi:hypothetical protein
MDAHRFDAVTRALAGGTSRRGLLKGVAAALTAAALGRAATGDVGAACPPGAISSRGRCICKRTGRPPVNGVCPCPSGQIVCRDGIGCRQGNCCADADCPAGQICADNGCVSIPIVPELGEDCSTAACQDGLRCVEGRCVCPGTLTTDVSSDPFNCGGCGNRCRFNETCLNGVCSCVGEFIPEVEICAPGFSCDVIFSGRCACTTLDRATIFDPISGDSVASCPAGSTPCIGPVCKACCPPGSGCDPSTGTCILEI